MPKYTAVIKIIEINESTRDRGVVEKGSHRELIDLEVRSATLEGIKTKINGHVALVDSE